MWSCMRAPQVEHSSSEFFTPLLTPGKHLLLLRGREAVRDHLLPLLRTLRASPDRTAAIGAAGREFARTWLRWSSVLAYLRTLLVRYGELYGRANHPDGRADATRPHPSTEGYTRVASEADLLLLTGMCERCGERLPGAERKRPATCALGRGGRAACSLWAPRGGGTCFEPRCCKYWDCGNTPLGCKPGE